MDLSVVIPVRDEESNIPELVARLKQTLDQQGFAFELIFVTDLNRDRTLEVLREQHEQDERVKVIKLSNSFGQHVAVVAGLEACTGRMAVIMDGDLQDFPEDIPKLHDKLLEGYDVVYGTKDKKNDSFIRNLNSKLFVKVLNRLSDHEIQYNTCMFRILSRKAIDALLQFTEHEPNLTFLGGLINLPTETVIVTSGTRQRGETKYGFFKQLNLAISSLLSFSTKPLRMISICGLIVSILSVLYMIVTLVQVLFFGMGILGWPTLVTLILFLGGVQLFAIGISGEYLGRVFIQVKRRPLYIVQEKIGRFK